MADKRKFPLLPVDTLLGGRPDKPSHAHPWQEPAQLFPAPQPRRREFAPRHHLPPQPWLWHLSRFLTTLPLPVSWPFVGLFKAWGTFCITGSLGSEQLAWCCKGVLWNRAPLEFRKPRDELLSASFILCFSTSQTQFQGSSTLPVWFCLSLSPFLPFC